MVFFFGISKRRREAEAEEEGETEQKQKKRAFFSRERDSPGQRNNAHNYSPSLYHLSYHE